METHKYAAALVVLSLAAAFSGCSPVSDGIEREPVSGSVTLDGGPLDGGSITLVPLGDGPTAGATIAGGSFSIPQSDGPAPGAYRVEIVSVRDTGRAIPDPEGPKGRTVEEAKNVVPGRYNRRSGLKADVKRGGPNVLTLDLDSTPDDPAPRGRR